MRQLSRIDVSASRNTAHSSVARRNASIPSSCMPSALNSRRTPWLSQKFLKHINEITFGYSSRFRVSMNPSLRPGNSASFIGNNSSSVL